MMIRCDCNVISLSLVFVFCLCLRSLSSVFVFCLCLPSLSSVFVIIFVVPLSDLCQSFVMSHRKRSWTDGHVASIFPLTDFFFSVLSSLLCCLYPLKLSYGLDLLVVCWPLTVIGISFSHVDRLVLTIALISPTEARLHPRRILNSSSKRLCRDCWIILKSHFSLLSAWLSDVVWHWNKFILIPATSLSRHGCICLLSVV